MSAQRKPAETELQRLDCFDTELKFLGSGDAEGTIEGYASLWDVVDSGNDRVKKGAFAKALKARPKSRIPMFFGHAHSSVPIGVWTEIVEDAKGLRVKGKLLIAESAEARTVRAVLLAGGEMGISIGYRTIDRKFVTADGKEHADWTPNAVRELRELELREISLTAMPMLDPARVTGVKGEGAPADEAAAEQGGEPDPIRAFQRLADDLHNAVAMKRLADALMSTKGP